MSTKVAGRAVLTAVDRVTRGLAVAAIWGYRLLVSPVFPATCRFYPSCSVYAQESISKYGLWRGGLLAGKRLLRCHRWQAGGYDPVP